MRNVFFSMFDSATEAIEMEMEICGAVEPCMVSEAVQRVVWGSSTEASDLEEYFDFLFHQASLMLE